MASIYYLGRARSQEAMGFYRECGGEDDVCMGMTANLNVNVGVDD